MWCFSDIWDTDCPGCRHTLQTAVMDDSSVWCVDLAGGFPWPPREADQVEEPVG